MQKKDEGKGAGKVADVVGADRSKFSTCHWPIIVECLISLHVSWYCRHDRQDNYNVMT